MRRAYFSGMGRASKTSDALLRPPVKGGIVGFHFHDLRHTAITNMRRAGIDPLTIMQISGHKTMECFTRYNSFREPDLSAAAERLALL